MQPIYDSWDESYKQPFGAVARRSECIFSIFMPKDIPLDYLPVLVLFRTGFRERFLTMNRVEERPDGDLYQVSFTPGFSGVHYYYLHLLLMAYAATSSEEMAITAPWKTAISFS